MKHFVKSRLMLCCVLASLVVALTATTLAQNIVTGGISGTVMDQTGAIVPNATVTLKSNSTGEVETTTTSAAGLYNFPLLKPGPYSVSISLTGFHTVNETAEVQLGQIIAVNIKLAVGNTSETVEVTSAVPLLQTEDANISTTFGTAKKPRAVAVALSDGVFASSLSRMPPSATLSSRNGSF